jgi:predicted nucleotidyltransferase
MDKKRYSVRSIVKNYIKALESENIPVRQAILFGSRVSGKHDRWSDIDIAIVSEVFEGDRFKDRGKIRKVTLAVSSDLSPLPFRPEDFTIDDPLVKEILATGMRIV